MQVEIKEGMEVESNHFKNEIFTAILSKHDKVMYFVSKRGNIKKLDELGETIITTLRTFDDEVRVLLSYDESDTPLSTRLIGNQNDIDAFDIYHFIQGLEIEEHRIEDEDINELSSTPLSMKIIYISYEKFLEMTGNTHLLNLRNNIHELYKKEK